MLTDLRRHLRAWLDDIQTGKVTILGQLWVPEPAHGDYLQYEPALSARRPHRRPIAAIVDN